MSKVRAGDGAIPVVVSARLEEPRSRWMWLVKWLLLLPHYIVLSFLWAAFAVVTVVAFFAISKWVRGVVTNPLPASTSGASALEPDLLRVVRSAALAGLSEAASA